MDDWGWEQLHPCLEYRVRLPVGPLFCVVNGATAGRPWASAGVRAQLRRLASKAGLRRRIAPHQLRHAHAVEMARQGVPLDVIQRQLGHANLGVTSIYLVRPEPERLVAPLTASSILVAAALSTSSEMLIASRAVMGVAGATIAPSTLSLIFTMFLDTRQRSTAIGVWIAAYSAGGAIGPVLGGVLLEFFWWGSVFLIGVPVMALLLVLGPRTLPEYRDPNARSLDLLSVALSLGAILGVVYGLKQLAQDGVSAQPVLVILAGLGIGFLFVRRQLGLESPIIDVRLFRIRAFSASLGTYFLGIFVVVGYFLFISQYLQLVLGLSPLNAALWSLPSAVGFIVGSTIAPRIIHRFRPSVIMGVGMAIAAAGTAMLLGLSVDGEGSLILIAVASVVISVGLAPVITLATELIVGSAPPEQAGAATGMSETSGELGGALGIAILGSIGTAVYRAEVADQLPADIPAEAADAALDTLGGALAIAESLPGAIGDALAAAAQVAFVDALHLVAAVAAVLAALTAILSAAALWNVPARSEPEPETATNATPAAATD